MAEIKAFHKGKKEEDYITVLQSFGRLNVVIANEPAVIANPSPGCNGTLLVHVLNHLSSNHASDANVHGNPYLDTVHHPRYIIQHIEDNSCRSAFVVIIVIEVVVNFSALWCAPCKTTAQAFCELADKYSSVVFLTVDVDELAELSTSWEIKATPTFFFLKDGRQVDKLVGGNMPELQRKTAAIVNLESRSRN
ncbi:thioredoxin H9 [Populus alba x Populus x berolinensis]|nr:thioredoxin H9 [Populus alba x Populus x berolinensis]